MKTAKEIRLDTVMHYVGEEKSTMVELGKGSNCFVAAGLKVLCENRATIGLSGTVVIFEGGIKVSHEKPFEETLEILKKYFNCDFVKQE